MKKVSYYYIFSIILIIYIVDQYIELESYYTFKRSHPNGFPLIDIQDDFLSPEECKDLKDYILKHELLNIDWGKNTIIRFNTSEDSKKMFIEKNLEKIYKIVERIKQPGTNAYIVNTAILSNSYNSEGYNEITGHYDDSISIQDWTKRLILPVCTTILYINVPENCEGGNLYLSPFGSRGGLDTKTQYIPKQGRKLTFRGDTNHLVEPFFCENNTEKRISLVFEQYKIPDKYMCDTDFGISRHGISFSR